MALGFGATLPVGTPHSATRFVNPSKLKDDLLLFDEEFRHRPKSFARQRTADRPRKAAGYEEYLFLCFSVVVGSNTVSPP